MDARDEQSQQTADYAMALDLCSQLTLVLDEPQVLRQILDIFVTLFAPQKAVFWVMENGQLVQALTFPASSPPPPRPDPGRVLPETTPTGFYVSIPYKEETIGIIRVEELAFPAFRERYLSLALAVVGVCGLAVSNARAHRRLEITLSDLRQEYLETSRLSEELRVINEELEERVRRRTLELETTMVQLREEIEQRKTAEAVVRDQLERMTLLLRELHHRVRNNLQIISSILNLQAKKTNDPHLRQALSESQNRVRTMSAVHEKILGSSDLARINLKEYLQSLVVNLLSVNRIRSGTISISLDIPESVVDINTAIPLGLIINELVSNSLRHAFPEGTRGEVALSLRDEGRTLDITCRDNGVGMPEGYDWKNPETVGLLLVQGLVEQMEGTIENVPGAGTLFKIRIQKAAGESGTMRGTYNQVPE